MATFRHLSAVPLAIQSDLDGGTLEVFAFQEIRYSPARGKYCV